MPAWYGGKHVQKQKPKGDASIAVPGGGNPLNVATVLGENVGRGVRTQALLAKSRVQHTDVL